MRPLSIRLRGMTRYASEVTLDLAALPPGLIAITGGIGQGKSTLLDCLGPVPLFRHFSTRSGGLKERATARDAEVDYTLEHAGHQWRMLLQVDPQFSAGRGKEEAYLWRDGEALTSGKVTDYDEAIARYFPPESVFFASAFTIQATKAGKGAQGFFGMAVSERKELFARLLGLERMQELARRAGEHRKRLDAKIGEVEREIAIEATKAGDLTRLRESLPALRMAADQAAANEEAARVRVAECQARLADARAVLGQLDEARQLVVGQRVRYTNARTAAEAARGPIVDRIAAAERLIANGDDTRERARQLAHVLAVKETATADWVRANDAAKGAAARVAELSADRDRNAAEVRRVEGAASGLAAAREALAAATSKVATYAGAGERAAKMEADVRAEEVRVGKASADANAESVAAQRALDAATRDHEAAVKAAGLLDGVPCGGGRALVFGSEADEELGDGDRVDCGTCQFLTAARVASESIPALAEALTTSRTRHEAAEAVVARVAVDRANLEADRARLDAARLAAVELQRATTAEATATRDVRVATDAADQLAALTTRQGEIAADLLIATTRQQETSEALAAVTIQGKASAARVTALAGADVDLRTLDAETAALPGYRREIESCDRTIADADASLAELVVPPEPEAAQMAVIRAGNDYSGADLAYGVARGEHRLAAARLSEANGAIAQLGDVDARVATLTATRTTIADRRASFALVEAGFGVNGIQALEIDAAGPEVSTITNELLEACFGARFAVALRTVREAGAGKVQREVFDVLVHDGERGGARTLEELSGGEQVLVDEALKLGIAVFNARRNGGMFATLFRDEADGALSEEIAARYPAMLRRAMAMGGFDRLFVISHRPVVWSQADARIMVDGGRVWIE